MTYSVTPRDQESTRSSYVCAPAARSSALGVP
eukprot:CAMPEP_0119274576 /NCGR_PEP_ID=MMETSP1329-20130426/12396_1 /TAXON_ID=114041 /ORGANISM="Genus nov. species nov., Strain RCC1024" /LENGTH=31 /DNA_ID= /DNA_START= /DNA_END= /DNA_ORIENTATION=